MPQYVLNRNAQSNGDHEVHNKTVPCNIYTFPRPENQIDLGYHSNCHDAVAYAKSQHRLARINGCAYCATVCHTS